MKPTLVKGLGIGALGLVAVFSFFVLKNNVVDPAVNLAQVRRFISSSSYNFPPPPPPLPLPDDLLNFGCMDPDACNFDPDAGINDVCIYAIYVRQGPPDSSGKPTYSPPLETRDRNGRIVRNPALRVDLEPRNTPTPNTTCDPNSTCSNPLSIMTWTEEVSTNSGRPHDKKITFLGFFEKATVDRLVGTSACKSQKMIDDRDAAVKK